MSARNGAWTLRWARGLGRQSGLLALNAFAIAALPLLDLLRPECASPSCATAWSQVLFVPRILYIPMLAVGLILLGSWRAQRKHARIERAHATQRELRAERPEMPPGMGPTTMLDRDLSRRTLRGLAAGGVLGSAAMLPFMLSTVGLRRCDPWTMPSSGLQVCSDAVGWADMLVAYSVWTVFIAAGLGALLWYVRSTSIPKPETLETPAPRRRLGRPTKWRIA